MHTKAGSDQRCRACDGDGLLRRLRHAGGIALDAVRVMPSLLAEPDSDVVYALRKLRVEPAPNGES